MNLRPYQLAAVAAIEAEWREHRSTLIVMPTGTGKTQVFAEMIRRAFPRRSLVLAHRAELIYQAQHRIRAATGWRVDVEMGAERADIGDMRDGPRVVVSTIQTQACGGDGAGRMTRFDPRIFGLVVIDEAHRTPAATYRKTLDFYARNPELKILGVTATPDRADEEALGQIYETVAYDYEILDAIKDGWLAPVRQQMIHVEGLDFSKCRTTAGDLNGGDLAEVMEYEEILHRVVAPTVDIVGARRTLVFAASVAHAERMAEMFNRHRAGMAAVVHAKTPKDDRERINEDFRSGKIQVVCNCGIYTEGADFPAVEVVVMARPTKSRALYAQMAGRAMRPADTIAHELGDHVSPDARRALIESSEKPTCLVLDFVGNSGRHKLCTTADILGGNVSEEVRELAARNVAKAGGPVDMAAALIAAQAEQKKREAARRARLIASARFKVVAVDPFAAFDLTPTVMRGWDRGKVLSEKQTALLQRQGIDPTQLDYAQARQLIRELFRRWDSGLASFKQCALLRKRGLPTNVTKEEASRIITEIAAREGWRSSTR